MPRKDVFKYNSLFFQLKEINGGRRGKHEQNVYKENELRLASAHLLSYFFLLIYLFIPGIPNIPHSGFRIPNSVIPAFPTYRTHARQRM